MVGKYSGATYEACCHSVGQRLTERGWWCGGILTRRHGRILDVEGIGLLRVCDTAWGPDDVYPDQLHTVAPALSDWATLGVLISHIVGCTGGGVHLESTDSAEVLAECTVAMHAVTAATEGEAIGWLFLAATEV